MTRLLTVSDLAAGYGEVDIVSGISLHVDALEIVTIAGTNGSGKSTLVKALMGLLTRVRGEMRLGDTPLLGVPAEKRIGMGVVYVPQVENVFPTLTVTENLQVVEGVADRRQRIEAMFDRFPALAERRRTRAGALSGGASPARPVISSITSANRRPLTRPVIQCPRA